MPKGRTCMCSLTHKQLALFLCSWPWCAWRVFLQYAADCSLYLISYGYFIPGDHQCISGLIVSPVQVCTPVSTMAWMWYTWWLAGSFRVCLNLACDLTIRETFIFRGSGVSEGTLRTSLYPKWDVVPFVTSVSIRRMFCCSYFTSLLNIVDWCFIKLLANSMVGTLFDFRHTFSKWPILPQLKHCSLTARQFFCPLIWDVISFRTLFIPSLVNF